MHDTGLVDHNLGLDATLGQAVDFYQGIVFGTECDSRPPKYCHKEGEPHKMLERLTDSNSSEDGGESHSRYQGGVLEVLTDLVDGFRRGDFKQP